MIANCVGKKNAPYFWGFTVHQCLNLLCAFGFVLAGTNPPHPGAASAVAGCTG